MAKFVKIQDADFIVNQLIKKKLTPSVKLRIEQAVENEAYKIAYERLKRGIGVDGKRISRLSVDYAAWKRRFVRGKLKHRPSSRGKKWLKRLQTKTAFRAKSVPNYGFLTGLTFESIQIRVKLTKADSSGIEFQIITEVGEENKKIVQGLEKNGRFYYGALANENTPTGKRERERLAKVIGRYL
jgi:hypothetical protein